MEIFVWLENTRVAMWVSESIWAYPLFLSLHAVGLAIVVGIFVMRDLKLLGMFDGLTATSFLPLIRIGRAGFVINAVSGVFLFASQAATFASSVPFLLKITMIVVAAIFSVAIQNRLHVRLATGGDTALVQDSMKLLAIASLLLWSGAIIAGRLVAYI